jgi:hypothetical protein
LLREELGLPHVWPAWLDRPALSRLTISSPQLLKPFTNLNAGKTWPNQVKPFNFLLVGHVRPFGYPAGVDPTRFQLVAPYESDASKWLRLPWLDRYSGTRIAVSTAEVIHDSHKARLQTFRDVIGEFRTHPEAKSLGPDGKPCGRHTQGLLRRRVVQETYVSHVGKEANKLEEVEAGLEHPADVVYNEYDRPMTMHWDTDMLPLLKQCPVQRLADATGLSTRSIKAIRNGHAQPRARNREQLARILAVLVREASGD